MGKLTPPAPQNRARHQKFYLDNPHLPEAKERLKISVEEHVHSEEVRPKNGDGKSKKGLGKNLRKKRRAREWEIEKMKIQSEVSDVKTSV